MVLVCGTSCHCLHRESALLSEALSAQNGSSRQDLAHPFSHERGFMPVFLRQSSHSSWSSNLIRTVERPQVGQVRWFRFVITEGACRRLFNCDIPAQSWGSVIGKYCLRGDLCQPFCNADL